MDPIIVYLTDETLHANDNEAKRARKRVEWFILYEAILYKCSYLCYNVSPWMLQKNLGGNS